MRWLDCLVRQAQHAAVQQQAQLVHQPLHVQHHTVTQQLWRCRCARFKRHGSGCAEVARLVWPPGAAQTDPRLKCMLLHGWDESSHMHAGSQRDVRSATGRQQQATWGRAAGCAASSSTMWQATRYISVHTAGAQSAMASQMGRRVAAQDRPCCDLAMRSARRLVRCLTCSWLPSRPSASSVSSSAQAL